MLTLDIPSLIMFWKCKSIVYEHHWICVLLLAMPIFDPYGKQSPKLWLIGLLKSTLLMLNLLYIMTAIAFSLHPQSVSIPSTKWYKVCYQTVAPAPFVMHWMTIVTVCLIWDERIVYWDESKHEMTILALFVKFSCSIVLRCLFGAICLSMEWILVKSKNEIWISFGKWQL